MTKGDKRALYIGGAIIVVIALLLFMRKSSTVIQQSSGSIVMPQSEGFTMPSFLRKPFVMPALPNIAPYERLSAIGACCSDCSEKKPTQSYTPSVNPLTIVFNEGNKGGNVYNYFQQVAAPRNLRGYASGTA